MDLVENRFGKTWKHFLKVLKVDCDCSLADVCRDQHTTFGGVSSWMSRRGYSAKQVKADVVRDYYGGVEPSQPATSSPLFTQMAPVMLSEEEFSLAGITVILNSGTTISAKWAIPGGVIRMLRDYERKEGDPCILRHQPINTICTRALFIRTLALTVYSELYDRK